MDLIIHNTAVLRSQHVLCMDHKRYCLKKKDESRNDEIERFFRWCAVSWLSRAYLHTSVSLLFFSFFFISGTPASYFIFERISNSRSVLCKRWHWGGSMEPGSDKVISLPALAPMALRGTWGSGSITSMMLGFSGSWHARIGLWKGVNELNKGPG